MSNLLGTHIRLTFEAYARFHHGRSVAVNGHYTLRLPAFS
jgi:hypothetical protein